jgi:hypothetical protein
MDPQTRGLVITSADWLREMHNSLSPPNAFSLDGLGLPRKAEDAYHFVVYLPVMGALYELDGLKPHALRHGGFDESGDGWLKTARSVIHPLCFKLILNRLCTPEKPLKLVSILTPLVRYVGRFYRRGHLIHLASCLA